MKFKQFIKNSTVVLSSGGVESTTLLFHLSKTENVVPLFVDYGQRSFIQEYNTVLKTTKYLNINEPQKVDLNNIGSFFREYQEFKLHIPIPHRNLLILSIATSFASQIKANSIVLGSNKEDSHYVSQSEPFLEKYEDAIQILENGIHLKRPFKDFTKVNVLNLGKELNIDYGIFSYSCMVGSELHCGNCKQCKSRKQAFLDANIDDTTKYIK